MWFAGFRSGSRRVRVAGLATAAGVALGATLTFSQAGEEAWLGFSGAADNSRYFDSTQITKTNVGQLQVAWSYPYSDTNFSPIVVRGTIFGRGRNGAIVALDAKTGREIWVHDNMQGMTTRGMNYWESRDGSDRRLIFSMNDYLQQIDAATGKSIMTFGDGGVVDLRLGLSRDPSLVGRMQSGTPGEVFENLIILGAATGEAYMSPPGDVRAYDILTGKLAWQFHTVPLPGEFGYDTWPKEAWRYIGGTNTWGELTVDAGRGIVYVPTGSPTYDYYGADRHGSNLFANCLLALDARTGKRLWHFQNVHHDLWDFDNNAAPQLTTITHNGRRRDVVAMAAKTGFLHVFDRDTGEPIWPVEERPVPKGDMPGEQYWPTQPYQTVVPPFSKQTMTEDDINPHGNVTPEARERFRQQFRNTKNVGLFTPISHEDTLHIPGSNGGALFGTTAAEPRTGTVYVIAQDNPAILRLLRSNEGRGGAGANASPGALLYQQHCQVCHGPNRAGTETGPTLLDLASRTDAAAVRNLVVNGKGRMSPFPHLTESELSTIVAFVMAPPAGAGRGTIAPGARGRGAAFPPGPVVASGPAKVRDQAGRRGGGPVPYPPGTATSEQFVINAYGTIGTMMKPPYTQIVAYDLNKPAIKWKVGFGDDPALAALGITNTGMTQMRNGMVVTSAGLIFAAGGDNMIRAYDSETGKVLWTSRFGGAYRGSPAMYEMDGRQFLLVPASGDPTAMYAGPNAVPPPGVPSGYVAYALPQR
jgi:quinoprotein glucose dehydrogenase